MHTKPTLSRRAFLRAGAATLAAGAATLPWLHGLEPVLAQQRYPFQVLLPAVSRGAGGTLVQYGSRARAAYDALQEHLYRARAVPGDTSALYLEETPGDQPYSYEWPFSQALSATLDLVQLPAPYAINTSGVQSLVHASLPRYWDGKAYASYPMPPLAGGGDRFYDDNAWTGLDLVRVYRLTGDPAALSQAQQVFRYLTSGWDNDTAHPAPGGVFWVDAGWSRNRNTCSTASSAELALRLFQATGQQGYLDWGRRMYDWVRGTLRDATGLYWDHIDLAGNIQRTQWSYNQGTMIGAGALLHSITGDASYLDQARATAQAALGYYQSRGYRSQGPAFNAIFFRNLLHLAVVDRMHLSASMEAMQGYAGQIWQDNRIAEALYAFPAGSTVTKLLDQAAVVQIFACLALDPGRYDLLV